MLVDAGGDGEDVGIEDDVGGGKADVVGEDAVGTLADVDPSLQAVGLSLLVEGHHDNGSTIAPGQCSLFPKGRFALLQADGVDDGLALHVLQPCLNDAPLRRVDDDGYAGDVRLGSDEPQEAGHGGLCIQQAFVHVHVYHLCAVLYLLAGDVQRHLVVALPDEAGKLAGSCDVGALTDVDEVASRVYHQRLQSGKVWSGG